MERRRALLAVLVGVMAVVMTGCQVRVATDIVVEADGSGDVTVVIVVDDELHDTLTEAGVDLREGLDEVAAAATWEVSPVDRDDATGVELHTTFETPEELGARVDALSAALTPDDGALLRDVELTIDDEGGYTLRASAGIDPPRIVGALPIEGDPAVTFDGDDLATALREAGDELARAELRVTFPTVPVAEGATIELSTATWELPVDGLATVTATAPPVPVTTTLILLVAAGIAAFILVALLVQRRRRR